MIHDSVKWHEKIFSVWVDKFYQRPTLVKCKELCA